MMNMPFKMHFIEDVLCMKEMLVFKKLIRCYENIPIKLVLDGNVDELIKAVIDAICAFAQELGDEFTIFVPST
jgi:hypothetical protein